MKIFFFFSKMTKLFLSTDHLHFWWSCYLLSTLTSPKTWAYGNLWSRRYKRSMLLCQSKISKICTVAIFWASIKFHFFFQIPPFWLKLLRIKYLFMFQNFTIVSRAVLKFWWSKISKKSNFSTKFWGKRN